MGISDPYNEPEDNPFDNFMLDVAKNVPSKFTSGKREEPIELTLLFIANIFDLINKIKANVLYYPEKWSLNDIIELLSLILNRTEELDPEFLLRLDNFLNINPHSLERIL